MSTDPGRYRDLLRTLHPGMLSPADAEVIVELAQLALDSDGHEDAEEIKAFFAVGKAVFAIADLAEAPTPTFVTDEEDLDRMSELAEKLEGTPSRELAYACALLLSLVDPASAAGEQAFMGGLRIALSIDSARANAIGAHVRKALGVAGGS